MNRIFYQTALGVLGCCSFLVSCSNDTIVAGDDADGSQLQTRVSLAETSGTLIFPGEAGIDVLYAQAFTLEGLPLSSSLVTVPVSNGQAMLRMDVPTDVTSCVALWAQNSHTDVYDLSNYPTVKVSYPTSQVDNDTTLLAYYGSVVVTPGLPSATHLELDPAVAQVNVGVSATVCEACDPDSAMAYLVGIPTAFNVMTGMTTTDEANPQNVLFHFAHSFTLATDYMLRVGSGTQEVSYAWLSMTYVLASNSSSKLSGGLFRFCYNKSSISPIVQTSLYVTQGTRTNLLLSDGKL